MVLAYPQNDQLVTLVAIMPPPEVQRIAIPLMSLYNHDMLDVNTAHISLFFPFVAYGKLSAACETLRTVCREIPPFEVTFSGYGYWEDGIYMAPQDPQPMQALFSKLLAHFPEHLPYGGKYGSALEPHITVGHFEDPAETKKAAVPEYSPVNFTVDRLNVLYGAFMPVPLIAYDVIHLGG